MNRREFLRSSVGVASVGWFGGLASALADDPKRQHSCILMWMAGGPSQLDTFDPKPDHANGGSFKSIETAVPGIRIGEHLPGVAQQMKHLSIVRSMATKEGDHGRATTHLRTGYLPQGSIQFPTLGALIAHEHDRKDSDLPSFVSIGSSGGSPGFLGPRYAPLVVGAGSDGELKVEDLDRPSKISLGRAEERLSLLRETEAEFLNSRPGVGTDSHRNAYDQAVRLMRESAARAFDLSAEPDALKAKYGRSRFGQGCLLARRLVERGVPFIDVTLGGWDTHDNNFEQVKNLCGTLDAGWSTLMTDLKERGLLERTTVVWMGEFGRTPVINPRQGRDHYPNAWSVVLGGAGVKGGLVHGRTSSDGMTVEENPIAVPDLIATICLALGVDPSKQNPSNVNRPIRIADPNAKPMREILA